MKVHPIPHASFETTRSRFIQILHHCSVSYLLCIFLSQTFILWTKRAHRCETFRLLSGWVKIHQIPYVMFETTSQFFFTLFITLQCHEKIFCTFLAETVVESLKFCTLMGSFCPNHDKRRKCMSLIFTGELLCVMTIKNDAKFEQELTCRFKIDMRNLMNFDLST